MASLILWNSVRLDPTTLDKEPAIQAFVKLLGIKPSGSPATTSRPDLMQRSSPPIASSITQNSVSASPIIQDMTTSQSAVNEPENVSSDRLVTASRPWIRDEPMPYTADLAEHETLATASTELMDMDDPFDTFPRPFVLQLDTGFPIQPCYLFSIPRELRDMITDIAISAGDINILQTSKQWHDEGIGLLYKRRFCHINVNLRQRVPRFNQTKSVAALIQNVNIEIWSEGSMFLHRWRRELETIRKFNGLTVPRQTCRMVLLLNDCLGFYVLLKGMPVPYQMLIALGTLIGFSRVILELHDLTPLSAQRLENAGFSRAIVVDKIRQQWSRALGPCTWHGPVGPDGVYLEFHPRKHWEANPGALPPNVQRLIDRWATDEWADTMDEGCSVRKFAISLPGTVHKDALGKAVRDYLAHCDVELHAEEERTLKHNNKLKKGPWWKLLSYLVSRTSGIIILLQKDLQPP